MLLRKSAFTKYQFIRNELKKAKDGNFIVALGLGLGKNPSTKICVLNGKKLIILPI